MKKISISLLVFGFLLAACTSTKSDNTPPPQPTQVLNQTSSTATAIATLTLPTTTPAATNTTAPLPTNFNKDNYQSFTSIASYSQRIGSALGVPANEVDYRDFSYSQNGKKIAVWGCAHNCQTMEEKYFLALLDADEETPAQLVQFDDQLKIMSLALSSTGEALYYSLPRDIYRFNTQKNNSELIWKANKDNGYSFLGISPDDQTLAISNMNSLTILALLDLTVKKSFSGKYFGNYQRPQFTLNGEYLSILTADALGEITVFATKDWNTFKVFPTRGILRYALSPDGSLLALAYGDTGEIELVDVHSGNIVSTTSVSVIGMGKMVFDPSGKLLVLPVSPGPDADMLESLLVIDVSTGVELQPLISFYEPGGLVFSADGNSILIYDYSTVLFEKWSLPNQEISKVEAFAREYFDALGKQNFTKAAAMTKLDEYDKAELTKRGLSTDNLAAAFESMCAIDEVPCLPLSKIIRVGSQNNFGWDYDVYFTLLQPNGTELVIDGVTRYSTIGVKMEADGSMRIIGLHPGMYMPYID